MRAFIGCLVAALLLVAPAHAQVDPDNPDHQFRAFAALSGGGKSCKVVDSIDAHVAQGFGDQMMGKDNADARKVYNQIYNAARTGDCANPQLVALFALAAKMVQAPADGVVLAYLDQGFCTPSADIGAMRLYAVYRQAGMSEERRKAAEEGRTNWRQYVKDACAKTDYLDMGEIYTNATGVEVWDFAPLHTGACMSNWAKTVGPFDCVYGVRPVGPAGYDDITKLSRQSVRAAQAKALALELDRTGACGTFTAAERAAGEAQRDADARFGLAKYNRTTKQPAKKDPDKGYAKVAEVAAAGAALAKDATCEDLSKPVPVLAEDAPDTAKGEQVAAASGAARIRETLDRVAMISAALPSCPALPNFSATKAAAEAYISAITPERRYSAAAEAQKFMVALDAAQCDPAKLGKPFTQTPLYAVDALAGAWRG